MNFTPQFTIPDEGDPYFNTISNGGFSRAIKGKPTDPKRNVLANCVGLAVGLFHKRANRPQFDLIDPVNAENLFENAKKHGLKTGSTPKLGALIVWQKGPTQSSSDGAGHVASVEEIGVGGEITTAESGYNAKKPFWNNHYKPPYNYKEGYTFLGFIYLPEQNIPTKSIRKGDVGDDVIWLQEHLFDKGYLRSTEIDGHFGKITLGGLLAFQFESGLDVDGVCGAATRKALME